MHIVLDKPGIMLQGIQNKVLKLHNVELALPTICIVKISRDKECVSQPYKGMKHYVHLSLMSYLCTGQTCLCFYMKSNRDVMCKHGYSWRGKPAVAQKLLVRGEHLSSIAIMNV